MRIGGIASGFDTESIVRQLMQVERQPLDRMFQQKQTLEWQRDAYREANTMFRSLELSASSLRLTSAFNTRSASSPLSGAFTATANASVQNGEYEAWIQSVATKTRNVSTAKISGTSQIDTTKAMSSQSFATAPTNGETFSITTYDANGAAQSKSFTVDTSKSLNATLQEINSSGLGVKAYYDSAYDKVVLERVETGEFKSSDTTKTYQIEVSGNFLTGTLNLDQTKESGGKNAIVKFMNPAIDPDPLNALTKEQRSNNVSFGGITINALKETADFEKFTVSSTTDQAFDNIKSFVDKYNETITQLRANLDEPRYRNFSPLTDEQRKEMSEREAELWDEKAKSGLLRRDPLITNALDKMRTDLYTPVNTTSQYSQPTQIGISTTYANRLSGTLEIDETKLRKALEEDPDAVYQLFNNSADLALTAIPEADRTEQQKRDIASQTGLVGRIRTALTDTMNTIINRAGSESRSNNQFTIGEEMLSVESQIDNFQRRLTQMEDRYWAQFTRMEEAISRANAQGAAMMNYFGTGQTMQQ